MVPYRNYTPAYLYHCDRKNLAAIKHNQVDSNLLLPYQCTNRRYRGLIPQLRNLSQQSEDHYS